MTVVVSINPPCRCQYTYSKSSPNPLEVPVLRACLPSTLSSVEYLAGVSSAISRVHRHADLHPHAQGEAKVQPSGTLKRARVSIESSVGRLGQYAYRSDEIWHKYYQECNISQNEKETKEGDHVGGQPEREEFDKCIPLYNTHIVSYSAKISCKVAVMRT